VIKDEEGNEKTSHGGEDRAPVVQTVHYLYIQVQTCLYFQIKGHSSFWPADISCWFSWEE